MPDSYAPEWTPAQLAALGGAGRGFVTRLLNDYVFSRLEGELLLESGQTCERLEQLRQARMDGMWRCA